MKTIKTVLQQTRPKVILPELSAPSYNFNSNKGVFLGVESMKNHMTDEGWQLALAHQSNGYELCGYQLPVNTTDVKEILDKTNPGVVVLQDKREWDTHRRDFREPRAKFKNLHCLKSRSDIFKVTVLKDSHQNPSYHKDSAEEIDCHAWIIYYHPTIVKHLATYVRPEHLIRTYHSLDSNSIPPLNRTRTGTIFSGAISPCYPLRKVIRSMLHKLPTVTYLRHPGYHRQGTNTPEFLQQLSNYKVSLCTCSSYGYSLRKIIESVACGCRVITDLPKEDVLPVIDPYLTRISSEKDLKDLPDIIHAEEEAYDLETQSEASARAVSYYNYHNLGINLVSDINRMQQVFPGKDKKVHVINESRVQ